MTEKPASPENPNPSNPSQVALEQKEMHPKRRGKGRRKRSFSMSTPPWPVRSLWETASEEERQKAHQLGALLLELWLGRISRKELGEKIGVPPLRVWQLSQQALAGMVVGLLKQPKRPPKGAALPSSLLPQDNPKLLRAQLEEERRQKQVLEELVDILKDLPANREQSKPKGDSLQAKRGRPKGKKNQPSTIPGASAAEGRKLAGDTSTAKG